MSVQDVGACVVMFSEKPRMWGNLGRSARQAEGECRMDASACSIYRNEDKALRIPHDLETQY